MRVSLFCRRPPHGAVRFFWLSLVCLALFAAISADVAHRGLLTCLDGRLAEAVYHFGKDHPPVYDFARWVTDLGGGEARTVIVIAVAVLLILDGQWQAAILFGLSQWWFPDLVGKAKLYFERPRPALPEVSTLAAGFAYPSGHSAGVLATYGMVVILCWWNWNDRRVRIPVTILSGSLIFCVGLSRMLLGVHWFSDVLGGYLMALAYVAAIAGGMRWMWKPDAPARAAIACEAKEPRT